MSEAVAVGSVAPKERLLTIVEGLSDERVAALCDFAAYLRAVEHAEEDKWAEENAEAILRDFQAAARGEVPLEPARQVAAELGLKIEERRGV